MRVLFRGGTYRKWPELCVRLQAGYDDQIQQHATSNLAIRPKLDMCIIMSVPL